jgi:nitrogen fixation protein NifQ
MLGGTRDARDLVPAGLAKNGEDPEPGAEEDFDRHVIGRVFLHAAREAQRLGEPIPDRLGLDGEAFAGLAQYLRLDGALAGGTQRICEPDDEELMVRELLARNRSRSTDVAEWLSCIIARRALEPNHLWEDLGLAARPDLSRLLSRNFAPLAEKNTRNMRWKKFLYRAMCEAEGFTMCPSPTCDSCSEFSICYSDDSGPSALARNGRPSASGF